jgi:hypothetical protein
VQNCDGIFFRFCPACSAFPPAPQAVGGRAPGPCSSPNHPRLHKGYTVSSRGGGAHGPWIGSVWLIRDASPNNDRRPRCSARTHDAANLSSGITTTQSSVADCSRTARGCGQTLPESPHQHTPRRLRSPPRPSEGMHSTWALTFELEGGLPSRSTTSAPLPNSSFGAPPNGCDDPQGWRNSWWHRLKSHVGPGSGEAPGAGRRPHSQLSLPTPAPAPHAHPNNARDG